MAFDLVRNDCNGAPFCEVSVDEYSNTQPNCDRLTMYLEIQYTCSGQYNYTHFGGIQSVALTRVFVKIADNK